MTNKRGMSVGMIFMLIFSIVVMAFIIFFGFDTITDLFCFGGDAQVQKSYQNIENSVENIYMKSMGSRDTLEVNIPSNTKICFVDSSDPSPNIINGWIPDSDVEDIVRIRKFNAWIVFCDGEEGLTMDRIIVKDSFCIISSEEIYIENIGRNVEIGILR